LEKACPIVLRNRYEGSELLVFQHPVAGVQLVKGTIEYGDTVESAAERELFEESGVSLRAHDFLCEWQRCSLEPCWGFVLMENGNSLPDRWEHYCDDDGGLLFRYFWQPIDKKTNSDWHALFSDAFAALKSVLASH